MPAGAPAALQDEAVQLCSVALAWLVDCERGILQVVQNDTAPDPVLL